MNEAGRVIRHDDLVPAGISNLSEVVDHGRGGQAGNPVKAGRRTAAHVGLAGHVPGLVDRGELELWLVGPVQVIDRSLRGFRVVTLREEGEIVLEILDVVRTLNRVPEALFARCRAFGDRLFNFGVQPEVGGETPGEIGGLTTTGMVLDPGTDVGEEGHGFAVHARESVVEDRREYVGVVLLAQVTGAGLNRHQRQRALAVRGRGGTVGDLCTWQQRLELVIGEVAVVGVHDHHVGDLITFHLGPDIVHGDEV